MPFSPKLVMISIWAVGTRSSVFHNVIHNWTLPLGLYCLNITTLSYYLYLIWKPRAVLDPSHTNSCRFTQQPLTHTVPAPVLFFCTWPCSLWSLIPALLLRNDRKWPTAGKLTWPTESQNVALHSHTTELWPNDLALHSSLPAVTSLNTHTHTGLSKHILDLSK